MQQKLLFLREFSYYIVLCFTNTYNYCIKKDEQLIF